MQKSDNKPAKLYKIAAILLLFSITALFIALTILFTFHSNKQQEAVQADNYQAVFLNNGQVYFGKIASVGGKTLDLRGIYYLQTNSSDATKTTTTSSNVSLVKLGCELHSPYDQMLINADQVIFWENIQDSSQVVKAIDAYQQKNGNKISCDTTTQNSTQQSPSASPTPSPTSSSTGTGTTGTGSTSTGTNSTTKTP